MTQRLNYAQQSPEFFKKISDFSLSLKDSVIEQTIRDLVNLRASQINGCAFCVDMHVKEAKIHGESELRLYHVAIWRNRTCLRRANCSTCLDRGADEIARGRRSGRAL